MTLFADLTSRGLIYQSSPGLSEIDPNDITLYLGFDATGDSLHIGHYLGLSVIKRFADAGASVIFLVGGGTTMIGDPGGKDVERPILPREIIEANKHSIREQVSRFVTFDNERVRMVDNADWLMDLQLIEFLREAGKYITISSMLDKESVSSRMDRDIGISYAEFSYQMLQAYDFMKLYETYGCNLQIGGSDQWGNIIQGVELIRKRLSKSVYALSFPLIVNPRTGKKFGKTESGAAIWLDERKTSAWKFYQFLLNSDDEIAPQLTKYFSMKPVDEIETEIASWEGKKHTRSLQKLLATEVTSLIHGDEAVARIERINTALFSGSKDMPGEDALTEQDCDSLVLELPVNHSGIEPAKLSHVPPEEAVLTCGLVSSKSDARRLAQQNGVKTKLLHGRYLLVRKGKKDYGLIVAG